MLIVSEEVMVWMGPFVCSHPCASAIPLFSTLISHSLIIELRITCGAYDRGWLSWNVALKNICCKKIYNYISKIYIRNAMSCSLLLKRYKTGGVGLMFECIKAPVWKIICVLWPLQTEWMCQLIISHPGKTLTWNGSHEILTHKYGGGVCMSVSEKEVKSQTVYLYQCSARSPEGDGPAHQRMSIQTR